MMRRLGSTALAACLLVFCFSQLRAAEYDPIGAAKVSAADGETPQGASVEFPVRFGEIEKATEFSASSGDEQIPHEWLDFAAAEDKSTAYMFLIDVSDYAARKAAIGKKMALVEELLKEAKPHQKVGVSVFAASLKEVAPVGTPHAALIAKMKEVTTGDLATLLYGSASQALDALARVEADRKALIIMSDGKAEDPEITRADVTTKALENGIAIYSLGYVAKAQDKKNLQGMQLMAADTGGPFIVASPGLFQMEPEIGASFYSYLENGGTLKLDTSKLTGEQDLEIAISTDAGNRFTKQLNHAFPDPPEEVPDVPEGEKDPDGEKDGEGDQDGNKDGEGDGTDGTKDGAAPPDEQSTTDETTSADDEKSFLEKFWWILALAALAVVGAIVAIVLMGGKKQSPDDFGTTGDEFAPVVESTPPVNLPPPVTGTERGWLETLDEPIAKFPIVSTAVRIGRGQDNEIRLANDSVSKHHAEIQIDRDGVFRITDLNSGNGIFVNGNRVTDSELDDGDIIELGDIRLRLSEAEPTDH